MRRGGGFSPRPPRPPRETFFFYSTPQAFGFLRERRAKPEATQSLPRDRRIYSDMIKGLASKQGASPRFCRRDPSVGAQGSECGLGTERRLSQEINRVGEGLHACPAQPVILRKAPRRTSPAHHRPCAARRIWSSGPLHRRTGSPAREAALDGPHRCRTRFFGRRHGVARGERIARCRPQNDSGPPAEVVCFRSLQAWKRVA
jgi:hypothetical protein